MNDLQGKIEATKAALHQQLSNRRRLQSEQAALLQSLLNETSGTKPSRAVSTNNSSDSIVQPVGGNMLGQTVAAAGDDCSHDLSCGQENAASKGVKGAWNNCLLGACHAFLSHILYIIVTVVLCCRCCQAR